MQNVIVGILVFLLVLAIVYIVINSQKGGSNNTDSGNTSGAQYASACKNDWLCSTVTVLGSVSTVFTSFWGKGDSGNDEETS